MVDDPGAICHRHSHRDLPLHRSRGRWSGWNGSLQLDWSDQVGVVRQLRLQWWRGAEDDHQHWWGVRYSATINLYCRLRTIHIWRERGYAGGIQDARLQ